jgi:hypothetical protein
LSVTQILQKSRFTVQRIFENLSKNKKPTTKEIGLAEDEGEQELCSLAFAYAKARTKFVAKFCTNHTDSKTKPLPPNGDRGVLLGK